MSIESFPFVLSQAILVEITLVGRLGGAVSTVLDVTRVL